MSPSDSGSQLRHMVWVCWATLIKLDAATWLETTRELRKSGWRVTLITAGDTGARHIRGVEVHCISRPQVYFFWQFSYHLKVLLLLARQWPSIDVIFFHQMSAPWLLPLRIVRSLTRRRCPLIVMDTRTLHMAKKETATWKQRLNGLFHSFMNVLANRLADGQTAITKRMAKAVRIPSRQLWGTWPSGVDPRQFAPARSARRWPGNGEPIVLIYIGVLHGARNLMSLCRAVEAANTEGMRFTLTLVGNGPEGPELEKLASATEGRVSVLPLVPHDRVAHHLADSHVGVLPFPDEEKFRISSPIKLFEYMASGLPILATRIVCHTDVVRHGQFSFWAEDATVQGLSAALSQIWNDRGSLASRGEEAAIAATSWTWEKSAKSLKAALEYGVARASTAAKDQRAGKTW